MVKRKTKVERKVSNIYLGKDSIFGVEVPEKYKHLQPVINAYVQYLDLIDLDTYERDFSKFYFKYSKFNKRLNIIKLYCMRSSLFYPKEPQIEFIEKIRKYADTYYDVVANREWKTGIYIFLKNMLRAMKILNEEFKIDLNYLEKITNQVLNIDLKDAIEYLKRIIKRMKEYYF